MRTILLFVLTFFSLLPDVSAQTTFYFSEGLVAGPFHQYGREAIYKDELAYALNTNALTSPQDGGTFSTLDQKEITWKAMKADSMHRFRSRDMGNGYLYLTYTTKKAQTALLNVTGNDMVYVNGVPHGGDIYRYGWMDIPVVLKKGKNEFYVRVGRFGSYGGIVAKLDFPEKPVYLNTADLTMPHVVPTLQNDSLWVGLVVVNTSSKPLTDLTIISDVMGNKMSVEVPAVPALSTRKVGVLLNGSKATNIGKQTVNLSLLQSGKMLDTKSIELETIATGKQYSRTFVSDIDGTVQYYSVAPQLNPKPGVAPALFFSVHGAEVQAINQARAYKPKDWGVLVAPTNRRPRGFNWEDWGRLDALEVLAIAKKNYSPDPEKIYLTGHSMGGHGTWFLGATYPGNWAAIAPCAGYPTLSSYGSHDGMIPDSASSPMEAMLLRASNPSNVLALVQNYKPLGVYINHGDADRTVSVEYARQMKKLLAGFHPDFSYYEYPGGSHWYGDISVDWPPLFDFFSWHTLAKDTATAANHVDFTTANPGVSGRMKWATIHQQQEPLRFSRIVLDRDQAKNRITGTTQNVATLSLDLGAFAPGTEVKIQLDSVAEVPYSVKSPNETIFLKKEDTWKVAGKPDARQKGTRRSGTLKEPFNHRMVFVYATGGSAAEKAWALDKAKFDMESWYYRGNGAVDLIADTEFDPQRYPDRGVVLYGNATNNAAWPKLLADCPIQVANGTLTVGTRTFSGNNLAAYFVWPRQDSEVASVAVVSGTGLIGMQAANANQYFSGGSGFPDFMIFTNDMLRSGVTGVKMAGFYNNDWSLKESETVVSQ
ncbi:alpha/beta hydrolase-fold protein [Salmonirosea aquatica]|uniref:Alpha/beta hydrolase n=1 Tax=Salmonirosea aquatica TaxID=2654236 RepID=A0A7C9BHW3_9BACT|nr:alpha/beta hydrolase [Cytophagaceae bacterium SJW1-29]